MSAYQIYRNLETIRLRKVAQLRRVLILAWVRARLVLLFCVGCGAVSANAAVAAAEVSRWWSCGWWVLCLLVYVFWAFRTIRALKPFPPRIGL